MPTRVSLHLSATTHPIQIVARRTGLSVDVIRAWEKRYGVVAPVRTSTGRRLYSDADITRLQLLARATLSGRSIGQVAGLTPDALATLMRDDAAATDASVPASADAAGSGAAAPPALAPASEHLAACLAAVERFDVVAFDAALRRAVVTLSAEAFLDTLVVPFWEAVLERVRVGTLRVAHEHLATAALRRALDRVVEAAMSPLAAPDLVATTPLGQPHELGALVVAATAAAEGWQATYLGPGVPAAAIAETTIERAARVVTLSLGTTASDRVIPRELRRLRSLLSDEVEIVAEGAAADAHRAVLQEIDAVVLRSPAALRAWLRARRDL